MNFIQLVNDEDIPGVLDAKMTFETNLYPSIKYIIRRKIQSDRNLNIKFKGLTKPRSHWLQN